MSSYSTIITNHYIEQWGIEPAILIPRPAPINQIGPDFRVLEFPTSDSRDMWTYATCGMSSFEVERPIELHIFSSKQAIELVDILTAIAHYHQTEQILDLGHTVNFGVPWQNLSVCTYGLISLPYLDGPDLEILNYQNREVGFYWLLPITKAERDFKKVNGIEALEQLFDESPPNYIDPARQSVV
jgi:hypothetical protein